LHGEQRVHKTLLEVILSVGQVGLFGLFTDERPGFVLDDF
jgi:hypothetical protein